MSETYDSDDEVTADGELYDVILMHSEKEKDLANTVCEKIRQLNLGDGVFPVIDTFENMSLLGNQEVDNVDYAVEQSTFIMFFRTKEFFKDEIRSFAAGVALDNAIRERKKSRRWSLIPLDIERKVELSGKASINSLGPGFIITTNGDFDEDMAERVSRTLSSKMDVRFEKEKRKAEKNARTLEKKIVGSHAFQHPSVDGGGVNPVMARVARSHQNDSFMNSMQLGLTSVKRPASESSTSLYPGPNCEETGDEALGNVPNYFEVANPSMCPEESTSELLPRTEELPSGDRFPPYDDRQGDASMRASSNSTAMSTYSASNVSNDTGLQPQYSTVADVGRSCAGIATVGLGQQAGGNLNSMILHRSQDSLPGTFPFRQASLSEFSQLVEDTRASLNSSDFGLTSLQNISPNTWYSELSLTNSVGPLHISSQNSADDSSLTERTAEVYGSGMSSTDENEVRSRHERTQEGSAGGTAHFSDNTDSLPGTSLLSDCSASQDHSLPVETYELERSASALVGFPEIAERDEPRERSVKTSGTVTLEARNFRPNIHADGAPPSSFPSDLQHGTDVPRSMAAARQIAAIAPLPNQAEQGPHRPNTRERRVVRNDADGGDESNLTEDELELRELLL